MSAEAAISTVVKLLGDLLIQKVIFLRGVEDRVGCLIDELTRMRSFLTDANKKQAQDEGARNWIRDIREVALDIEDTIDMYSLNVENAMSKGRLERCACLMNHLSQLDRIGNEIESILGRLVEIDKSRERYGIKDLGESAESSSRSEVEARRRLDPRRKGEDLVGLEDDVTKLLVPIVHEEKKGLSVVAVVGMGGIGKSTLAREVYNHPDVISGRFDCRAWVVISSKLTMQETIKQLILETAQQEKEKVLDKIKKWEDLMRDGLYLEDKLKEILRTQLSGKTYFIVLDDVWEKEHWDLLMTLFPDEQDKTSRLLFTTRHKDITTPSQILHEMKPLDPKKSWELFLKKAFAGNNSNGGFPYELEQIGRDIVNKCEGLPLSITVMGGLLAEKGSNREWKEALNDLNSHLGSAENSISAILELSYENLSPELKYCFLCLAFFKEDATIPVKRVLYIMLGQGLIQKTERTTEVDIGRGYLDKLISRNLVQVKDFTLNNQVKSCHLHDSLRKLCLKKAQEEIGLENLMGDCRVSLIKPRHQVVHCNNLGSFSMDRNKHIRSIFLYVLDKESGFEDIKSSYWKSFQHLKILNLEVGYSIPTLPVSLRFLLGLKQLRLHTTNHEQSLKLPTWLNKFKRLELLDMVSASVVFPDVALELESLRHMYANYIHRVILGDGCKNIESLKYIKQRDWMRYSSRLIDGSHIRKLGIVMDDQSTMRGSLEKLENLVKLVFWFSGPPIDLVSIPYLGNLTKIKLRGKMRKFPSASIFPPNLSHLTLKQSELGEDSIQELEKLPNLMYLKLKENSYSGKIMQVSEGGFRSLRGLSLRELFELRSLLIRRVMPELKQLEVYRCPRLDTAYLSTWYQLQELNSEYEDTAAEVIISSVVQLLRDLLIHKVDFLRGVEDQVQWLRDELKRMQSFLRDVIEKQAQDDRFRNWIPKIRKLALDAKDAIEVFILNVENAKSRGLLKSCTQFLSHVKSLNKIGKEIKSIRDTLVEIDISHERYESKDTRKSLSRSEVRGQFGNWHKNEYVVGMEDDVKKLLEPILDKESKGLSVVAVVGMGGIGKTTLAREIYNHPDVVSGRFQCQAWVLVSMKPTPQETVKHLIVETTSSEQEKQKLRGEIKQLEKQSLTGDKYSLQRKLEEVLFRELTGKSYFIVLDDVWELEHWVTLKTILPDEKGKSSILLFTTRIKNITNQCQILHEMKGLDEEKSWELLRMTLTRNSYEEFPNEFEHIGIENRSEI